MTAGNVDLTSIVQEAITNLFREEFSDRLNTVAEEKNCPEMISVREAIRRTGLAEQYIRYNLIPNDKIRYIKAGKRTLINWQSMIDYLNKGDGKLNHCNQE